MPADTGTESFPPAGCSEKLVKKVVDYKLLNGKRYYKVKWKCTWEVEDSLLPAQDLVDQFWGFVNRVKSESCHGALGRDCYDNQPCQEQLQTDCSNTIRKFPEYHCPPHAEHHNQSSSNNPIPISPCKMNVPDICSEREDAKFHSGGPDNTLNLDCEEDGITDEQNTSSEDILPPSCPDKAPSRILKSMLSDKRRSLRSQADTFPQMAVVDNFSKEKIIDVKMKRKQVDAPSEDDDRRFQCDVCNMAFKRKDMCRRHMRTHSNDFCYFCAICQKGFIRRYVLVKHLSKDHNTSDESQIISTKRRRRDDNKQEQPSMVPSAGRGLLNTHGDGMHVKVECEESVPFRNQMSFKQGSRDDVLLFGQDSRHNTENLESIETNNGQHPFLELNTSADSQDSSLLNSLLSKKVPSTKELPEVVMNNSTGNPIGKSSSLHLDSFPTLDSNSLSSEGQDLDLTPDGNDQYIDAMEDLIVVINPDNDLIDIGENGSHENEMNGVGHSRGNARTLSSGRITDRTDHVADLSAKSLEEDAGTFSQKLDFLVDGNSLLGKSDILGSKVSKSRKLDSVVASLSASSQSNATTD